MRLIEQHNLQAISGRLFALSPIRARKSFPPETGERLTALLVCTQGAKKNARHDRTLHFPACSRAMFRRGGAPQYDSHIVNVLIQVAKARCGLPQPISTSRWWKPCQPRSRETAAQPPGDILHDIVRKLQMARSLNSRRAPTKAALGTSRPVPLLAAGFAAAGFPRFGRRRARPWLRHAGKRIEDADRKNPFRHLH